MFCVLSARSLSLRSHCLFSILRISPTESKWFDFRSTTFLAESLFFLDSLTSEYFKRFMCLEEIGDMSKKYMHIWGNSIPFIANSLSSERNKGFQPVLCLVPKYVNRFFRGPGIYLFIQTSDISPHFGLFQCRYLTATLYIVFLLARRELSFCHFQTDL